MLGLRLAMCIPRRPGRLVRLVSYAFNSARKTPLIVFRLGRFVDVGVYLKFVMPSNTDRIIVDNTSCVS